MKPSSDVSEEEEEEEEKEEEEEERESARERSFIANQEATEGRKEERFIKAKAMNELDTMRWWRRSRASSLEPSFTFSTQPTHPILERRIPLPMRSATTAAATATAAILGEILTSYGRKAFRI